MSRARCWPIVAWNRPVEVRNAEGGGKGRVGEAAGVARHENSALLGVGGHARGGEAGDHGAKEVIAVVG
jgi:hypothetical protein